MAITPEDFGGLISQAQLDKFTNVSDKIADDMLSRIISKTAEGKDNLIHDLAMRAVAEAHKSILDKVGDNPFVRSAVNTTLNYSRAQSREILRNLLGIGGPNFS